MIKAILFDLDGVIIDTEPIHYEAHRFALNKFGIKITKQEYIEKGVSRSPNLFYSEMGKLRGKIIDVDEAKRLKEKKFNSLFSEIKLIKGSKELLNELKPEFKIGLVTAETFDYANKVLTRYHIRDHFDVIVSGQDLKSNKPSPEPYLIAASRLNLSPGECIVV